ncbi:hypothetical protein Tco_0308984 [Tanacetum coccineum]
MPNVPLPHGIGAGGSPRCQETTGDSIAQTRSKKVPTPPHDSPLPRVNTLGSDEGSMTLYELIVKKLEQSVKSNKARRRAKIIVSDDEDVAEDSSKQGRMIDETDQDAGITLVTPTYSQEDQPEDQLGVLSADKVLADAAKVQTYTRRRKAVSTASKGLSTAEESVITAGASMPVSTAKERQRIARVQEEASSSNIEEWEDIQATIEADEELALRMQADKREKYFEVEKARLLQLKRLSFDELKNLFEATMKRVNTFTLMESDVDKIISKIADESSKRDAKEELNQESSKRQKTEESSKQRENEDDELSQEELQQMLMIVLVEEFNVEALQVKYPIIDWEIYIEDSRRYWRIIRVGNHTEAYQIFANMLKKFDRDDLGKLWDLVKERFSTTDPTDDKEKELYVKLKRLFEPDNNDTLWKLQRYMHDPLVWRLYDTCGVHHVSSVRGYDIFMLVEKDYPLTRGLMTMMLANKI